jgi:hypothetical protein
MGSGDYASLDVLLAEVSLTSGRLRINCNVGFQIQLSSKYLDTSYLNKDQSSVPKLGVF